MRDYSYSDGFKISDQVYIKGIYKDLSFEEDKLKNFNTQNLFEKSGKRDKIHVMDKRIKSNIWKLYVGSFLMRFIFIAAVIVPFLGELGLSMQEILITEAVYAAAIVLLEIPSGYFADRVGRKISISFGAFCWIIGIAFYAFSYSFYGIIIGAIFWGIGSSFNSGAMEALLFDSLAHMNKEKDYKRTTGNFFFYGRMATVIGSIIGGILASIFLKLTAYIGLIPVIIWFLITFTLKETDHEKEDHETWPHLKRIFRESFVHNKQLRYFIIFTAIGGFFAIGFWLNQRYWEFLEIPLIWFGIIVAGMNIFSAIGAKYATEIEGKIGEKAVFLILPVVPIVIWLVYANFAVLWVVPLAVIAAGLRGFSYPVFNDFVQKHTTSDRRATIMSMMSFLQRGIYVIFAPFLGWITDIYSIQTAFLYSAGILFIFSTVSLLLLRKVRII